MCVGTEPLDGRPTPGGSWDLADGEAEGLGGAAAHSEQRRLVLRHTL